MNIYFYLIIIIIKEIKNHLINNIIYNIYYKEQKTNILHISKRRNFIYINNNTQLWMYFYWKLNLNYIIKNIFIIFILTFSQ